MTTEIRRRVVLVVLVILVVPLAVMVALQSETDPPSSTGDYLDCLPYKTPTSVAGINRFVRSTRATPGFAGGDVGASTQLSDGRSLWVFGDTTRPAGEPGASMVRNSILVMGNGCASVLRTADNGPAVPDREDGVGYWPMGVVAVPDEEAGEDRVAVGLMRVRATGQGMWDFEVLGSSVANFVVPVNGTPELVGVTDLGPDEPDLARPLWGAAVEVVGKHVYVYGTSTPGGDYVFGYSLHVARTTVDDYLDESSWEYYDGAGWSRDASNVASLIPAETGVSRVLSVFEQEGSWYAVSKQYEFVGTELVIWKADSPTGPFVSTGPVAEIPSGKRVFQYMPLAHPGLLPRKGTVVVSWSVNAMDPEVVEQNPVLYRPRFRRVTLP
ncbi:DUF4185 domain-containing protein [Nocardioides jishulii]|uniref:DUF4185 domain-containing protein n=1 Tax=Nocardioides jishulii TaxID=2575440 RepID=A0A4U2YSJ4_9ACTN|nr:DUF4185 domain-containing protein [Nocardioides jishulii]QCX28679.1 DUF4185 domain-containing protein [Nocardioides jishulii]TKI64428.1 DUF4185 domain-containing protein [Nocardioides jishulii]